MSAPSASAIALSIAPQAFDIRPFNGAVGALTGDNAMTAKVGETVLIIHSQANRDTRPHLIGGHGERQLAMPAIVTMPVIVVRGWHHAVGQFDRLFGGHHGTDGVNAGFVGHINSPWRASAVGLSIQRNSGEPFQPRRQTNPALRWGGEPSPVKSSFQRIR